LTYINSDGISKKEYKIGVHIQTEEHKYQLNLDGDFCSGFGDVTVIAEKIQQFKRHSIPSRIKTKRWRL